VESEEIYGALNVFRGYEDLFSEALPCRQDGHNQGFGQDQTVIKQEASDNRIFQIDFNHFK